MNYEKGVYGGAYILKDVKIKIDTWGNYISNGNTETSKYYFPTNEQTLKMQLPDSE